MESNEPRFKHVGLSSDGAVIFCEMDNGKTYAFYRYDGAGHGFFYYDRPSYQVQQAMDGWAKVFDFFGHYLAA